MVRFSKIGIVNRARELSSLPTVSYVNDSDELHYQFEKALILTEAEFRFASKEIDISSHGEDEDGYFNLPTDYLKARNPATIDRIGNRAHIEGDVFRYTYDVNDEEQFSTVFVDILIYGMAGRLCEVESEFARVNLFNTRKRDAMNRYIEAEAMDEVIDMIH